MFKIEKLDWCRGSHRTGSIAVDWESITETLGFPPNGAASADGKVIDRWDFRCDECDCAIWDYKGSHLFDQYSTFGPARVFRHLFGDRYTHEVWDD
ncbi:MAG: hypothetical protein F9B45_22250 [Phycisphaera sp. RhM]|nr:hypothetical protein [Phycisphaera sp. RhM]